MRYDRIMGRTALYRDPAPFRPARAEVQLDADVLLLAMPDGRQRRQALDGFAATLLDGFSFDDLRVTRRRGLSTPDTNDMHDETGELAVHRRLAA